MPRWAEVGGRAEMLKRIDDPQIRPRLVSEMEDNLKRRGGADSLLIVSARDAALVGKSFPRSPVRENKPPVEAALDLIRIGRPGRRVLQHERERHRSLHEAELHHHLFRRLDRPPAEIRHFPEEAPRICLRTEADQPALHGPQLQPLDRRNISEFPNAALIREGYFADIIVLDET